MPGKSDAISLLGAAMLLLSGCAARQTVPVDEVLMLICHEGRRTVTLPEPEAVKHIDHGDTIGACSG